jgi:hypothetical protein
MLFHFDAPPVLAGRLYSRNLIGIRITKGAAFGNRKIRQKLSVVDGTDLQPVYRLVPVGSADLPFALLREVCYHSRQSETFQVTYNERLGLSPGWFLVVCGQSSFITTFVNP